MKLLTEVADQQELMNLRILFESKGILLHTANEDSARNFGLVLPARKIAVFVQYEEQYEDAFKLFQDENHEVQHPMDITEHQAFFEQNRPDIEAKLFKIVMNVAVVSFLLAGALIFYFTMTE